MKDTLIQKKARGTKSILIICLHLIILGYSVKTLMSVMALRTVTMANYLTMILKEFLCFNQEILVSQGTLAQTITELLD